jgi:uncharacterized protein YlaI
MKKEKPEMTETEEQNLRDNPINDFCCSVCKDAKPMVFEEFKHHLFDVHKIKADQLKGKKQMVMHMDGAQWFSSSYQWELETGLKFTQFTKMARAKDDMMRFGY